MAVTPPVVCTVHEGIQKISIRLKVTSKDSTAVAIIIVGVGVTCGLNAPRPVHELCLQQEVGLGVARSLEDRSKGHRMLNFGSGISMGYTHLSWRGSGWRWVRSWLVIAGLIPLRGLIVVGWVCRSATIGRLLVLPLLLLLRIMRLLAVAGIWIVDVGLVDFPGSSLAVP
jgi:hypothetical protein